MSSLLHRSRIFGYLIWCKIPITWSCSFGETILRDGKMKVKISKEGNHNKTFLRSVVEYFGIEGKSIRYVALQPIRKELFQFFLEEKSAEFVPSTDV